MNKGTIIVIVSLILLVVIFFIVKNLFNPIELGSKSFVSGTEDIKVSSQFTFLISPDDSSLVYINADENTVLIDLNDGGKNTLTNYSFPVDGYDTNPLRFESNFFKTTDGEFSCSDCPENYVGERYSENWEVSKWVIWESGNKEYSTKEFEEKKASIYEKDTISNKERKIVTMNNLLRFQEKINELRLSPNGRYLAFQIKYGSGFVSSPILYILDIESGKIKKIEKNVYYDVHWSSDSNKLYYYSQNDKKGIYFIEINSV